MNGGMVELAEWIWGASWHASVLVVLVVVTQFAFRKWLNPTWRHALWGLVVARLLLPVLPESPFSVFNVLPRPVPVVVESLEIESAVVEPVEIVAEPSTGEVSESASVDDEVAVSSIPATAPVVAMPAPKIVVPPMSWTEMARVAWLFGSISMFLLMVVAYVNMRRKIVAFRRIDDERLLSLLAEAQSAIGIERRIELIEAEGAVGPALFGLFHTRLVLPRGLAAEFSDDELRNVFLHECAHLRRHDLALNWLVGLLRVVHWFNPVLWWAFARMRSDRELACDDLVLRASGESKAQAYGDTIVRLLERAAGKSLLPGMVGIVESDADIKQRITRIVAYRKATGWSVIAAILLTFVLAHLSLTNAVTNPADEPLDALLRESRERQKEIWILLRGIEKQDPNGGMFSSRYISLSQELSRLTTFERMFKGDSVMNNIRLAKTLYLRGQFELAEAEYKDAMRIDPMNPLLDGYLELVAQGRREAASGLEGEELFLRLNANLVRLEQGNIEKYIFNDRIDVLSAPRYVRSLTSARQLVAKDGVIGARPVIRAESGERAKVLQFVHEGKGFYELEQFDKAEAALTEAVPLEPKSDAAIYYRQLVAQAQYDQKSKERVHNDSGQGIQDEGTEKSNHYYLTNAPGSYLTGSREGAKRIERKLDELVISELAFDEFPMSDVIEGLNALAKKLDSEGKGIPFLLAADPPPIGKLKGAPLELPDQGVGPGPLADVVINLPTPLKDVKLRHVLDAIVKTADIPIRYVVEEYAVVFGIGPMPNKASSSAGRRQIESKLDEIVFEEILYPQVMLNDVVKDLIVGTKHRDSHGKGLNFMMAGTIPRQPSKPFAAPVLDARGNAIPTFLTPLPHELRDVIISITQPLKNMKLRHVLDAIVKTADKPIRYVVEDYAIVFQPAKAVVKQRLHARIFKVDPELMKRGLAGFTPLVLVDELDSGQWVDLLRDYFAAAGVDVFRKTEDQRGRSLYYNETNGMIVVRASLQELDIVSQAIGLLNVEPQKILLEVTGAWIRGVTNQSRIGVDWIVPSNVKREVSSGTNRTNEAGALALSENLFGFRYADGVDVTKTAPLDVQFGDLSIVQRRVLSDPQYRTLVNAIETRDRTDVVQDRASFPRGQIRRFWFPNAGRKGDDSSVGKGPQEGVLVKCRVNTTDVAGQLRVDVRVYENKRATKEDGISKSFLFRSGSGSARFPSGNIFMLNHADEEYSFVLFVRAALVQADGTELLQEIDDDTWVTSHPSDFTIQAQSAE